jgi:hypothetical protein
MGVRASKTRAAVSSEWVTIEGLLPDGASKGSFRICSRQVEHLRTRGPLAKYHELSLVQKVLKSPLCIYKNLRRSGQRDGLCYLGKPDQVGDWWDSVAPVGHVFAVYLTCELTVFEFGWEIEDKEKPNSPVDYGRRFEKILWQR